MVIAARRGLAAGRLLFARNSNRQLLSPCAEGRVYMNYQRLEAMADDGTGLSNADIVNNFKEFITKAEPTWDVDKKNQLFYQ